MINKNGKEIADVRINDRIIDTIYKGAALVWEAIRSCFGKGFWINDKPWNNNDGWKNK